MTNELDTLGFLELPAAEPAKVIDMTSFDSCSYFKGDTLLHAEVPYRPFGFTGTAAPFRLRHDGWSFVPLLLCLLRRCPCTRRYSPYPRLPQASVRSI